MTDRRFSEDEVARVLQRAAEEAVARSADDETAPQTGLTLTELQAIAAEAGIPADAVARAAAAIASGADRGTEVYRQFGLPVAVARTVEFAEPVSDAGWERLVTALQHTFRATGRRQQRGDVRIWRNGNLRAQLEPTPTGHRLRLSTQQEAPLLLGSIGTGIMALAAGLSLLLVGKGALQDPDAPWFAMVLMATVGLSLVVTNVASLLSWGRERRAQMERLAVESPAVVRDALPPG